ncbi:MAG: hypothetical protein ACRYF4_07550 [Janthinobacterium lividum]
MVLESISDGAGMCAGVDLERINYTIRIQHFVQLTRVYFQPILITNIHGDGAVTL